MKSLFSILILISVTLASWISFKPTVTAEYYFSTSGSDGNAGTQASPWQSLGKMQATILAMNEGDSLFLKRGDTWYGQLRLESFAGNTRYVGAYGIGDTPVITGFVTLSSWTPLGGNKYEASFPTSLPRVGIVTIDGSVQPMGRYPNANAANGGYLTFTGGTATSITGTPLTGTPDYTGWEVVVRKRQFIMDKGPVTSQSGSTINFTPTSHDGNTSGWGPDGIGNGFFFQNNFAALDVEGEWYYNSSPARFDIYMSTNPAGHVIKASSIDNVAFIYAQNNLTIENIRFEGSNVGTFRFNNNNNCTVRNCDIMLSGLDATRVFACTQLTWSGNKVESAGNNGGYFEAAESTYITNSIFRACGLWPGMGKSNGLSHLGVILGASSTGGITMINSTVDSVGYNGIHIAGNNLLVKNNYVNNFCRTIDDGGGIYSSHAGYEESNRIIEGNIITNGKGNKFGTNLDFYTSAIAIYWDDKSSNVSVINNFIANMSDVAIYGHNNHGMVIRDNTIYNTKAGFQFAYDNSEYASPIRTMTVKNNVVFQPTSGQAMFQYYSLDNDVSQIGVMDSNYYCRPAAEGTAMININQLGGTTSYTLNQWKTLGRDVFTRQTPAGYVSADSVRVEINPTPAPMGVSLGNQGYLNMKGSGLIGDISLPGYSGRLIIRKNLEKVVLRGKKRIVVQQ